MELRTFCRVAGIFLSLGTGACTNSDQPGSLTAEPASTGTPSTGDLPPQDEPEPTTTGSTSDTVDPGTTGELTTDSTGTTGPSCGDGMVDENEECDLGADNSNVGPCTLTCRAAVCGDGLIYQGKEECDDGEANSWDYAACRPDCVLGPRCGDSKVDPGHEDCDLGDLNGTGDNIEGQTSCTATCRWLGRLVFVSSKTYSGSLGGVSGADLKCQALAQAAGLTNPTKYRAWISDGNESPISRFEQIDLVGAPYVLRNGRIVAEGFPELVELGPLTGISLTEKSTIVIEELVWTNTTAFGKPFSPDNHCSEWTSEDLLSSARLGLNAVEKEYGPAWITWLSERQWTSHMGFACDWPAHLYCFEDGEPDVLP